MPEGNNSYISWYSTDTADTSGWRIGADDSGTATTESDVNPWVMPVAEAARATIRINTQAPQWGHQVRYSIREWYEEKHEALEDIEHKADWEL